MATTFPGTTTSKRLSAEGMLLRLWGWFGREAFRSESCKWRKTGAPQPDPRRLRNRSAHNPASRETGSLDNAGDSSYIGRVSTVDSQPQRLEFLQGTLEVLILRSLQAAPNHAYGISQFLKQQSENEFLVDNGSLYPALQRLLQRQWITAQWRMSPNVRRAKYYRLTPLGRKQLVAASSKWLRFVEAMGRILAPEG
jgi:PadR family transcriptional regulator, regulatory protein PadR